MSGTGTRYFRAGFAELDERETTNNETLGEDVARVELQKKRK